MICKSRDGPLRGMTPTRPRPRVTIATSIQSISIDNCQSTSIDNCSLSDYDTAWAAFEQANPQLTL